ncbi:hypothetical protein PV729_04350 [Streptomyces europaeiscabiei]|uniref:Uncharacterized protein n=1 Tax=Streptomyces europaeiscabiei TaxID=146819 RepID=A0ABU4N5X3_9ACTN|nr:hypothetical protein [Streptomyces europaeiscabiei]MDX3551009.1 hypothetical protein [Streptomyces europaeiscabiei]MDX3698431.1 hypothetical protein [Streptomyces europaeiscabiei]
MSDAVVTDVTALHTPYGLIPMLKLLPTGTDSGWALGARQTLRPVEVRAEHVRLIHPGFAPAPTNVRT